MEKLQAAIARARQERGGQPALNGFDLEATSSHVTAWQALTPFEPSATALARNRVTANARGPARSAIDLMRTRLLDLMKRNNWRRVMITSPTPSCGKTTVALNLALALQRQHELRTLLIDMDLPRSSLGRMMGLQPEHSVHDLLKGEVSPVDQMVRIGDNLAVSASARGRDDCSEVLKSSRTQACIEQLEATYAPDVVLFDFPPFFANDDAIAAARFVDCAIIVGAAEQTTIQEIDLTERDLSQYTEIAGVVLNKCRFLSEHTQYNYG